MVQNRFASYEVHTFLQYQYYCQFWKLFNPEIIKFLTGLKNWQTD